MNWEHIFTSFTRHQWATLYQNQKNLLAVHRKGFSLQYFSSHLFLSARYRPFQSSWRRGLFPQQFQHSTPTTPLTHLSGISIFQWYQNNQREKSTKLQTGGGLISPKVFLHENLVVLALLAICGQKWIISSNNEKRVAVLIDVIIWKVFSFIRSLIIGLNIKIFRLTYFKATTRHGAPSNEKSNCRLGKYNFETSFWLYLSNFLEKP